MSRLPEFFDWRGEIGRYEYFIKSLQRFLIFAIILALNIGFYALMGWDVFTPEKDFWSFWDDGLMITAATILYIPISIRRLNDARVNLWWLFWMELIILLPSPPENSSKEPVYLVSILLPYVLWLLFVQFKPGKSWQNRVENRKRNQLAKSRARVTYSE